MHEVELVDRVCGIVGAGSEGAPSREDVRVIVATALDVLKIPIEPDGQINTPQFPPDYTLWRQWLETAEGQAWRLQKVAEREGQRVYDEMQRPGFNEAMATAFAATPKQLGRAAVEGAKKATGKSKAKRKR